MAKALELLNLTEEVQAALLDHAGLMGSALHCVLAYEKGQWEEAHCRKLDHETIRDAYLNAVEWTRTMMQELAI